MPLAISCRGDWVVPLSACFGGAQLTPPSGHASGGHSSRPPLVMLRGGTAHAPLWFLLRCYAHPHVMLRVAGVGRVRRAKFAEFQINASTLPSCTTDRQDEFYYVNTNFPPIPSRIPPGSWSEKKIPYCGYLSLEFIQDPGARREFTTNFTTAVFRLIGVPRGEQLRSAHFLTEK
jgi:hypothetical protein